MGDIHAPLAIFGLDVASVVQDAIKAIVDLVIPHFGADWTSHAVTWLVALPDVSGPKFPALNAYAHDLTAMAFGLVGATTIAGALQLWAGTAISGAGRPAESLRRAAIAAGVLTTYPALMHAVIVGINSVTAAMIRDPRVVDGLDKAFGEALVVSPITAVSASGWPPARRSRCCTSWRRTG